MMVADPGCSTVQAIRSNEFLQYLRCIIEILSRNFALAECDDGGVVAERARLIDGVGHAGSGQPSTGLVPPLTSSSGRRR